MSSSDGDATAVSGELTVILARLGELAQAPTDSPDVPGTELVDRIAVLEQARAALAAAQHTAMVAFARTQIEAQSELVTAGRLDPRTLATDPPHVRALLAAGRISERSAQTVVAQTSHLDPRHAGWSTRPSPEPGSRTWGSGRPKPR